MMDLCSVQRLVIIGRLSTALILQCMQVNAVFLFDIHKKLI